MREFVKALSDVLIEAIRLFLRIIEKQSEFLVEIAVVLSVYFGVAAIMFHYHKPDQAIGWLGGGAIMTVLVQAFRNRLGGDQNIKPDAKPEDKKE